MVLFEPRKLSYAFCQVLRILTLKMEFLVPLIEPYYQTTLIPHFVWFACGMCPVFELVNKQKIVE